jgi:hypothetical protein
MGKVRTEGMHGHFMYKYSIIIPSDGALRELHITHHDIVHALRLIHGLSVKMRVFRDSAVSMSGETMRGRGSRGKERPIAGLSQQTMHYFP